MAHNEYIDKRIADFKKLGRYKSVYVINTNHDAFVKAFASNVFTNLIRDTFRPTYLKKYPCPDCKNPSEQRCHGIGEERPLLIKRALEKVYPDITIQVSLEDVCVSFLEEHKTTKFTFKCKQCHKNEKKLKLKQ